MLREWTGVRQRPEEGRRRWFTDEEMDLIVWYSDEEEVRGFQLCYGKETSQHALTWFTNGTYSHARIDDGETGKAIGVKETPILVQDGTFDARRLAGDFKRRSTRVDPDLRSLVYERVSRYPHR